MNLWRYLRYQLERRAIARTARPERTVMCCCDAYCFCPRCEWDRATRPELRRAQLKELGDNRPKLVRVLFPLSRENQPRPAAPGNLKPSYMEKFIELRNENGVPYAQGIGVADAARILSADESLTLSAHVDGKTVFTRYDDECEPEDIERVIRRRCPGVAALVAVVAMLMASCTVTVPVAATGDTDGTKQGRASAVRVFGAVVQGDASIAAACRQGGVRFVQTVDLRKTSVLGVYRRETCIVTGE